MDNIIRFCDLNYDEKLKLTNAEVEGYIKLECAFEGIKILPEPIEPVKPEIGEKNDYFRIGYISEMIFVNAEDAAKVLKVLETCDVIHTDYADDYTYVNKIDKFKQNIGTVRYYSKVQYEEHKEELEKYNREKKSYDMLREEYDKYRGQAMDIANDIWDEIEKVRGLNRLLLELTQVYKNYLEMAKGDSEIASSFLNKAYKDSLEELKEGIEEDKYEKFLLSLKNVKL